MTANEIPHVLIVPSREILDAFYRSTIPMSNHDYDIDEITNAILNALSIWHELDDSREELLSFYQEMFGNTNQTDIMDSNLLAIAVIEYYDSLRHVFDCCDCRLSDGTLFYDAFDICDKEGYFVFYNQKYAP